MKVISMTTIDKNILESYSNLFEGLSPFNKLELIERLSKSLKAEVKSKEKNFFKSFGSFGSEKSPEKIVEEIKASRNFKNKDIKF
jgi:hypothetical protein